MFCLTRVGKTTDQERIGAAIAQRLAKDGFSVVVNDIDGQAEEVNAVVSGIKGNNGVAHGITADVSSKDDVLRLVQATIDAFGELNVMVANAGILETSTLLEMTVERWDRTYAINTRGVFLCWQQAAQRMIDQGKGGKLIAACSISGYRPSGKAPAYCSSKVS
jgi:meso-butanediol dehydrogenase/(S,S)-butanediol dehydrogenase/diacetyl reductase